MYSNYAQPQLQLHHKQVTTTLQKQEKNGFHTKPTAMRTLRKCLVGDFFNYLTKLVFKVTLILAIIIQEIDDGLFERLNINFIKFS